MAMSDVHDESTVLVAVERVAGNLRSVETKLDTTLKDLQRRADSSEVDRAVLHGRITNLSEKQAATDARVDSLAQRVVGAFGRYAPIVISALALVIGAISTFR